MATVARSVSGDGYGYGVLRADWPGAPWVVRLAFPGAGVDVAAGSFDDCCQLGERFARCWSQWRTVQRRERALAQGFAVLGW
jgi:hypothetical protein